MPIKLKKTNIQYDIDTPEDGYIILGFDENGNLVTKNDAGDYEPIINDISTGNFDRLEVNILTVGNRVSGVIEGNYSIGQGLNISASGDTSYAQGNNAISSGVYSYARGTNVQALGILAHASGSGANAGIGKLTASGINTFVHMDTTDQTKVGSSANYSAILGGQNHNIGDSSFRSVILGGFNNSIGTSITNSVILGGSGQVGVDLNTVYVPRLVLQNWASTLSKDGAIYYDGTNGFRGYHNGNELSLGLETNGTPTNNSVVTVDGTGAFNVNTGLVWNGSLLTTTGNITCADLTTTDDIIVGDDLTVNGAVYGRPYIEAGLINSNNLIQLSRSYASSTPLFSITNTSTSSSADAAMSFTAGGDTYTMGIDNGSSDVFKIYHGTALGTTDNESIFEWNPTTKYCAIGGKLSTVAKFAVYVPSSDPGIITNSVAVFENDRVGSGTELNIPNRGIHIACGVNSTAVASMIGNAVIMRLDYTNYNGVGQIYYNNTGNLFFSGTAVSDERRKANIVPTNIDALSILSGVTVYDFNWKKRNSDTEEWGPEFFDETARGYIAQRVNPIYPLATRYNEEMDLWEVPKEEMVPVLHEAILQQQTKIEELESSLILDFLFVASILYLYNKLN